ncbi:PHD-zinc-finger like domain-containing protein [Auriculariales sp. MPI-PUGE-AT-0066]|nr:PHD-zinc-finger like domain-containing protein [Auriculariales sp. MPI-PUGE-AT-0066]
MAPAQTDDLPPPLAAPLPIARFRRILEEEGPFSLKSKSYGVPEAQAYVWGYNKSDEEFSLPPQYIHHVEPLESELAQRVEYDLDEQDQEWIDAMNAERKKEHLDQVSYELFEVLMDRLEKEYFELVSLPLTVVFDCYGVPYIPEGQWLCRKCTVSPESPVSCALCPNEGGAFKQTTSGHWVHLLCAIWIPEVVVANITVMEPIENVDRIPKNRMKLTCSICRRRGPCVQCDNKSCYAAFHVTCARQEKFLGPMKALPDVDEAPPLRAYCEKHLPLEMAEVRNAALEEQEAHPPTSSPGRLAKSARAHAKSYHLGPPLVPSIIVDHLIWYTTKNKVRKMKEFIISVCKYWSLKREARRGAPLLKRLHLEPWTTSTIPRDMNPDHRKIKLGIMADVRKDLEKLRLATGMVQRREREKKSQATIILDVLKDLLLPHLAGFRAVLAKFEDMDRSDFFKYPISSQDLPDYFDIITTPMCWKVIGEKIDNLEYWDAQAFAGDINLVLDNAIAYNKKDSKVYKAAARMKERAAGHLAAAFALVTPPTTQTATDGDFVKTEPVNQSSLSELEVPMDRLQLLFEQELVSDHSELDFGLGMQPLQALLATSFLECVNSPSAANVDHEPITSMSTPTRSIRTLQSPAKDVQSVHSLRQSTSYRGEMPIPASIPEHTAMDVDILQQTTPLNSQGPSSSVRLQSIVNPTASPDTKPAMHAEMAENGYSSTVFDEMTSANKDGSDLLSSPRGIKRKRPSIAPAEVAPVVIPDIRADVDDRSSFALFNSGWVLDAGTRRHGRQAPDSNPPPPARKEKRRTKAVAAQPQTLETAPSNVQTAFAVPALAASLNQPDNLSPLSPPTPEHILETPTSINAVVLTTQALSVPHEPVPPTGIYTLPTTLVSPETPLAQFSRRAVPRGNKKFAVDAVMQPQATSGASTSDISAAVLREKKSKPPINVSAISPITYDEGKNALDSGTMVWAKLQGFPWYPAIIRDYRDLDVPYRVKTQDRPADAEAAHIHLVCFESDPPSWGWIRPENIQMLGDDPAKDAIIRDKQRYKNQKERWDVSRAFKSSMAQMAPEGYVPMEEVEVAIQEPTTTAVPVDGIYDHDYEAIA